MSQSTQVASAPKNTTEVDSSVKSGPYIIVSSKRSEENDIAFECRRKGFLVGGFLKTKGGHGCILSMSPKLVVKLALEINLSLQPFAAYSPLEKLKLSSAAIKIIQRSKAIDAEDVWVSHDKNMLKELDDSKGDTHLSNIKEYYGSKIAMYFGWLAFYTKILAVPSIAGVVLFAHQVYLRDVDSIWVPFFCVLIALWSTYFLEFWKRRGNELSFHWNVYGVEDADAEQDLAKGADKAESNVVVRQMLSFVTVLSLMYVMVRIMLYFKNMQHHATEIYGADSYYKHYPTVLYSILPAVATIAFEPIAEALNRFEGHTTKVDAENSRIMKNFALEFVNRYCALFHAAFWLKDLDVLRSLLISLLTINAVLNNVIELGMPMVKSYMNRLEYRKKEKKQQQQQQQALSASTTTTTETASPQVAPALPPLRRPSAVENAIESEMKRVLEEELTFSDYDLNADYLEIVIQYGYVTMFVVAFPLAPALALLNNIFESRVDLFKLTECRRPALNQRSNIGSWQHCMEFISFLAVITNCYLIAMVSTHFEMIVPTDLEPLVQTESGRLIAMMFMEHILLGFKIMMMYIIDDVPRWIREAVALKNAQKRAASSKDRINQYAKGEYDPRETDKDIGKLVRRQSLLQTFAEAGKSLAQRKSTFPLPPSLHPQLQQPAASPRDTDDLSIQTIGDEPSERPLLRKRAGTFLSHLTGRSHSKPGEPSSPRTPVIAQSLSLSNDEQLRREESALDEVAQLTADPSLHRLHSEESLDSDEPDATQSVHQPHLASPVDRLVSETQTPFGFDPSQMMILICLPLVLQYLQITPWLYLPAAVLFFGYLQAKKDRIDRKMAMGIVADPTLLKLILEEMPNWPTDGEFQQLEWVNFMMQKFWPMLAIVGEEKALRIGQPILNRMKPSFLSELTIKKFNFGTVSPRFLGIRMHTRDEEGVIRCDLEMRYAGDPQIIIQVGPTVVEILNLRISCMLRCEFLEFTPRMTPFKLATATMMKKPFVDFNIKVAGMDIMATKSMTNLVHNLFHKVLHSVAMYPKKIFVPMGSEAVDKLNLDQLRVINPVGILYLKLERGVDLIQANLFGASDPYVEIETTDQDIRSQVINNNCNPIWNEEYDIIIYDRGSQVINFTVFDSDRAKKDMCLGKAEFEVNKIPFNTTVQKQLILTGVVKGSIIVSCTYIPMSSKTLASGGDKKTSRPRVPRSVFKGEQAAGDNEDGDGEKDVLFDLPIEELTSDELLISGDLALQGTDENPGNFNNNGTGNNAAHAGLGILTLSNVRLRSLKPGASGNWKPCVCFHVGLTKKQTRSKKNIVNPEFDERFAFVIKDRSMMDRILVKVLDKNRIMTQSRQIGEVAVNLFDLMHMGSTGKAATIEKEYEVISESVDYMVSFKMQWFSSAGSGR